MTDRAALIRAIHAGARELGLSDEARRDLMECLTGCRSARDMTAAQMGAVLAEYDRLRGGRRRWKPARNPLARMVHAQWGELCRLGVVRASPADRRKALRAWAGRQLRPGADVLVDPDILADEDLIRLIEALKAWLRRVGAEGAAS